MDCNPLVTSINRITNQRCADMRHMHPYLVGPASFQLAFHQRRCRQPSALVSGPERFECPVVRDGVAANTAFRVTHHRHLLPVCSGPGDRHVHRTRQWPRRAARHRKVFAFNIVFLEQFRQAEMRRLGLGRDQNAGRQLVDPVNNARPLYPANDGAAR